MNPIITKLKETHKQRIEHAKEIIRTTQQDIQESTEVLRIIDIGEKTAMAKILTNGEVNL